jgi:hypothetical protein
MRIGFAERIGGSIGILKDGDPALSTATGFRFTKLLRARQVDDGREAPAHLPTKRRSSRRQRVPR